jgi:hypothetical protein
MLLDYFHTHPEIISYNELLKFFEEGYQTFLHLKRVVWMISALNTTNLTSSLSTYEYIKGKRANKQCAVKVKR